MNRKTTANPKHETGQIGEALVVRSLVQEGHKILTTNVRAGNGELDIVSQKQGTIYITEVKSCEATTGRRQISPVAHYTQKKYRTLLRTTREYLYESQQADKPWLMQLALVHVNKKNKTATLEILQNIHNLS